MYSAYVGKETPPDNNLYLISFQFLLSKHVQNNCLGYLHLDDKE